MVKKVATFQDITLGFDGSASVRFMKGMVDENGGAFGLSEPHRLTIQPDVTDIAGAVLTENAAILTNLGFEVPDGEALATYVQGIVLAHRADPIIAANTKVWCDAAEAALRAKIAANEEAARIAAVAVALAAEQKAEADEAAHSARRAEINAAVQRALKEMGVVMS